MNGISLARALSRLSFGVIRHAAFGGNPAV
jgi:hypothetical protein